MSVTPELVHDPDREELRQIVRKFIAAKLPIESTRARSEAGEDLGRDVWNQMAQELGLQGMAIAEEQGGGGQGYVELGIVLEELGRSLAGGPFFSTVVLAASALQAAGDTSYLPRIASGEITATTYLGDGVSADASTLSGTTGLVIDGATADLILVLASGSLYAVEGGYDAAAASTLDLTRPQAILTFDKTPATLVSNDGDAIRDRVNALACIGLANEMVGAAERAMEIAIGHAKERFQFGRQIASFQAVKHKAADMLIELEQARSTALYAAWVVDNDPSDLPVASSLAKIRTGQAFTKIAGDAIQMLGGIGFTWEHDMHMYFKRAHSSALLFGDATQHRKRLTSHLGLLGAAR